MWEIERVSELAVWLHIIFFREKRLTDIPFQ